MLEKTFYVFLVICLLNQQVYTRDLPIKRRLTAEHSRERREIALAAIQEENTSTDPAERHHREKRWALTTLVYMAMISSLAVDITAQVSGCHKLVSGLGALDTEFKDKQRQLDVLGKEVVELYGEVESLFYSVDVLNDATQDVYDMMVALEGSQTKLMVTLDPTYIEHMNATTRNISAEVQEATTEVTDFEAISIKYNGVFSTVWKSMWRVHGFLVRPLWYLTTKTFTYAQNKAASSVVSGAPTRFSNAVTFVSTKYRSVKSGVMNMQKVQTVKSWMAANPKTVANIKAGIQTAWSLLSIGFEIYNIIKTLEACGKIKTKLQDAVNQITPEVKKLQDLKDELTELKTNLTADYAGLKAQYTSASFESYINEVLNLLSESSDTSAEMTKATTTITTFMTVIEAADIHTSIDLVHGLRAALRTVSMTYTCISEKLQIMNAVEERCTTGGSTMERNYDSVITGYNPECVTASYFTKDNILEAVAEAMINNSHSADCVLNSVTLHQLVCAEHLQAYSAAEIASRNGITLAQTKEFISSCSAASVTYTVTQTICGYKQQLKTLAEVETVLSEYIETEVQHAYTNCPKPSPNDILNEWICSEKEARKALSGIQESTSQYDQDKVLLQYNSCPVPSNEQKVICMLRGLDGGAEYIESYEKHWGKALVDAVVCPTTATRDQPSLLKDLQSGFEDHHVKKLKTAMEQHYAANDTNERKKVVDYVKSMLDEIIQNKTQDALAKMNLRRKIADMDSLDDLFTQISI